MKYIKLLLGALLAAIAIFAWGFLFWVLMPQPEWGVQSIPAEHLPAVNEAFSPLEPGAYRLVDRNQIEGETDEQLIARHQQGPIGFLYVGPGGAPMGDSLTMLEGFLHAFVAALLVGFLLMLAKPSLPDYFERLKFVVIAGLFASVWCEPTYSILVLPTVRCYVHFCIVQRDRLVPGRAHLGLFCFGKTTRQNLARIERPGSGRSGGNRTTGL